MHVSNLGQSLDLRPALLDPGASWQALWPLFQKRTVNMALGLLLLRKYLVTSTSG
ncbi:hypothetical protein BpHYR1_054164 [Brachionus plicatilis]|uniref:Uncharacterized protein n=1 Tax=Brachionus plicatilis TaxID=10195 RepID=A0A3M7P4A8_BRAPC|nr:hypothetical protein BpHYR1_054164 [Brachionus plicatilis]